MTKHPIQTIDTNVIVRFLVKDQPAQFRQASVWFKEAEQGQRSILVTSLVVAETTFVLESVYQQSRADIAATWQVLLSQKWLKVPERPVLLSLWPWYLKKLHFVDSYLLAWAKHQQGEVLTFDQQVKKLAK